MNKVRSVVSTALLAAVGFVGHKVWAQSTEAPAETPLFYSGTLEESGGLVDGKRDVQIKVLADKDAMAKELCTITDEKEVVVTRGRFRVQLRADCARAFRSNPTAWIKVTIGGAEMGTTQVGAVPYALNAIPSKAVMFFNLAECPVGWTRFGNAEGRTIVGANPGGSMAAMVGFPLSDLQSPKHAHGMQHTHQVAGTTNEGRWSWRQGGFSCCGAQGNGFVIDVRDQDEDWARSVYDMNFPSGPASVASTAEAEAYMPYVQLLPCQKD